LDAKGLGIRLAVEALAALAAALAVADDPDAAPVVDARSCTHPASSWSGRAHRSGQPREGVPRAARSRPGARLWRSGRSIDPRRGRLQGAKLVLGDPPLRADAQGRQSPGAEQPVDRGRADAELARRLTHREVVLAHIGPRSK